MVEKVTSACPGRGNPTFWMLPNREHSLRIFESDVTCHSNDAVRRCFQRRAPSHHPN